MPRATLQSDLRKRGPFASSEQEVVLGVLRTNELFQHRFGQLFRSHGLTQPQYNILRILRGEGSALPCLEVAERMVSVVPGITNLVDRLEKAGLIHRQRSAEDRRVIYIDLTKKGMISLLPKKNKDILLLKKLATHYLAEHRLQNCHEMHRKTARESLANVNRQRSNRLCQKSLYWGKYSVDF